MIDQDRAVIDLLVVDEPSPVNRRDISHEDLDQQIVVEVVPQSEVGPKLSPDGFSW
jgi:hypothetical protein